MKLGVQAFLGASDTAGNSPFFWRLASVRRALRWVASIINWSGFPAWPARAAKIRLNDVIAFIGNCGFECAEDYNGLPDYIAVELEFMQEITDREAGAWRAGEVAEARRLMTIERDFMKKTPGPMGADVL